METTQTLTVSSNKSVEARDFDSVEVGEINSYISANVPYSVLQTLFPLTENYMQKAQIYTIIYRIVYGAANYAENLKTRNKILQLLAETEVTYHNVYALLSSIENSKISYGKHMLEFQLRKMFEDVSVNFRINKLIDIFLIFAEKLVLLETDKVAGLELDIEEGKDMYKKINSQSDSVHLIDS